MKIAIYRNTSLGYTSVMDVSKERYMDPRTVRTSAYVEVEFEMLPDAVALCDNVEKLRAEADNIVKGFKEKVAHG